MPRDWSRRVGQTLLSVRPKYRPSITQEDRRERLSYLLGLLRQRKNKKHGRRLRQVAFAFRVQRRHITFNICAAARRDGHKLPPCHRKTDWRGYDSSTRIKRPQFFSGLRVQRKRVSFQIAAAN